MAASPASPRFSWAWRQRVTAPGEALAIAKLASDGKIDDARKLADALVKFDDQFKIGVQMRDVLADDSLDARARDQRIDELAAQARKPIDAALREARLRQRLDPRLHAFVTREGVKPDEVGITLTDGSVRVTVLASKIDDVTLTALRRAGLTVESAARSMKLVVGTAPRDKLAEVALLDSVRKIDPTQAK